MNFNLLLSAVSALSFVIEFPVNTEERQDYFLFEGNNKSVHLFRENTTLYLHFTCDNGMMFSLYNTSVDEKTFQFSWDGFEVDEKAMILQRFYGKIPEDLEFEHFTFISPIVEMLDIECSVEPIIYNHEVVNYWYFFIMIFVVAIFFDSKTLGINFLKRLLNRMESDYVTMDKSCGPIEQENINDSNV